MISSLTTNNWVSLTFILMIGLLVMLHYFFEKRFLSFIQFFHTKQYFVAYISITNIYHPFNILFLIFQVCCYAILILKLLVYFNYQIPINQFLLFLKIALAIVVFYLIRYLLGKLFAVIFRLKKEQNGLTFVKLNHLSKVSLLIFPFLILVTYFNYKDGLLFVVLSVCTALLLLLKYLAILQQNQKLIFSKLFYFILYLCILEILPLILVFNTLIR